MTHPLTPILLSGDRTALSKAITTIESTLPEHENEARQIIEDILPHTGNSIRIGITGVPGVGKSTFIEALGNYLITKKHRKVAVLAIDPTSSKSKGSILGDKTRMEILSRNDNAFIRPSPSAGVQGGVAGSTREAILLCEAAGYNVVLIETVGVGQSEISVHSMVDLMMLLLLPGAGDELQGMKRGIVELADLLVINKADGDNLQKVKFAQAAYKQALHLFPPSENQWNPDVVMCSALSGNGIPEIWNLVESFEKLTKGNNSYVQNRKGQQKYWLKERILNYVYSKFREHRGIQKELPRLEQLVEAGTMSVFSAVKELSEILSRD